MRVVCVDRSNKNNYVKNINYVKKKSIICITKHALKNALLIITNICSDKKNLQRFHRINKTHQIFNALSIKYNCFFYISYVCYKFRNKAFV